MKSGVHVGGGAFCMDNRSLADVNLVRGVYFNYETTYRNKTYKEYTVHTKDK